MAASADMKEMTVAEAKALGYPITGLPDTMKVSCPPVTFPAQPPSVPPSPAPFDLKTVAELKAEGVDVVDGVPDSTKVLSPASTTPVIPG